MRQATVPDPTSGDRIAILLIEDNHPDTVIISEYLFRGGKREFDLTTAEDLDTGLRMLSRERPDVLLLDLSLPDSDGPQTFSRAHEREPGVPIIVIAGEDDEPVAIQMLNDGAQDYLVKGHFNSDLLKRCVKYALGRAMAEQAILKANADLNDFAHTVSHDMKGPLSAIYCASKIIGESLTRPADEERRDAALEAIDLMNLSLNGCFKMIADVLATAISSAVSDDVTVEHVDVAEVVDQVINEHLGEARKRNAEFTVESGLGRLKANRTHVYQVFSNLMTNAMRHNNSEHPTVRIAMLASGSNGNRYIVRDNGPGIVEEDPVAIFKPFLKGETGETGIGLATVSRIVDLYDGEIKAYNDDDGACFEFVLGRPKWKRNS
jgi:signal transduction histidine kinase